jgi:hypothetical protein
MIIFAAATVGKFIQHLVNTKYLPALLSKWEKYIAAPSTKNQVQMGVDTTIPNEDIIKEVIPTDSEFINKLFHSTQAFGLILSADKVFEEIKNILGEYLLEQAPKIKAELEKDPTIWSLYQILLPIKLQQP